MELILKEWRESKDSNNKDSVKRIAKNEMCALQRLKIVYRKYINSR